MRASSKDHSYIEICPLHRHRTIIRKARSNRADGERWVPLCEVLEVAKGIYYNYTLRNKQGEIKNTQTYGAVQITVIMRERGIPVVERTVTRIMHENGLFSIRGSANPYIIEIRNARKTLSSKISLSKRLMKFGYATLHIVSLIIRHITSVPF